MESEDQILYEKIITINETPIVDQNFSIIRQSFNRIMFFAQQKCIEDNETMHFFQVNFTNSENCPPAKDLKVRWCVTKNEIDK